MGALASIAHLKAAALERRLDVVLEAMENGSVITVDYAVSVLAQVASSRKTAKPRVERVLLSHLKTCRPKEVAQHAERSLPATDLTNAQRFAKVLKARLDELTDAQKRRVNAVLRRLPGRSEHG
jgi:DNA-binding FrmR family transcriptional regulator